MADETIEESLILAYLDHNVLDYMLKGDPDSVKPFLKKNNLTPVFSDESLNEIAKSIGFQNKYLILLKEIGARYLVPIMCPDFKPTGQAEIRNTDPFEAYTAYVENQQETPEFGYGLSGMLQKFYGGHEDKSFEEIFTEGAEELKVLLEEGLKDLNTISDIDENTIEQIKALPELVKSQFSSISLDLDKGGQSPVRQLEIETGIGSIILNNIKPPNVMQQIWDLIQNNQALPEDQLEIETFFGIKAQPYEADADRERTPQEKVNAIYHQLNYLGYYRDSKMRRINRFNASFSDMTHAGLAAFCHLFLCRDESLVNKAAAAYEYLNIPTKIIHYLPKKRRLTATID